MAIKLAIDPGHGLSNKRFGKYDPGAIGRVVSGSSVISIAEADIALQIALTLKWVLTENEIPVFLTRKDDRDSSPLGSRDEMARAAGCTHYLSIHCNAGGGQGTETFYRDSEDHGWAEVVQRCALVAWDLGDRGTKHESLTARHKLSVMDFKGPCALLEVGFIDNREDLAAMMSRTRRIEFAGLLAERLKGL